MISSKRLEERIEALSKISEEGWEGITRRALSKEDREAQALVKSWMEQAGMQVYLDPAGNLIGRKEGLNGDAKPIVIGSHIDSTFNGGKYDGTIGVIGGIETVQHITEEGIQPIRPIEVIAFCEEEGSRFKDGGVFGSRAMTGKITPAHLEIRDEKGISRREALKSFGVNPDDIFTKVIRKKGDIKLYLEMHIEQGPVLESKDIPVGIIQGINGRYLGQIIVEGEANHTGATPMDQRYDALVGASELVVELENIASSYGTPTVGTVTNMRISPGFDNVIPERVEMTGICVRDLDNERRDAIINQLKKIAKKIEQQRGLRINFSDILSISSALCSQHIIETMKSEAEEMNLLYLEMPSGACHDAQNMAEICDMGMIFIRSTGGSHNPNEDANIEDISLGTELLARTAIRYLT